MAAHLAGYSLRQTITHAKTSLHGDDGLLHEEYSIFNGCVSGTLLGLPPHHLVIQQEVALPVVRLNTINLWHKRDTPYITLLKGLHQEFCITKAVNDRVPKLFVFDKNRAFPLPLQSLWPEMYKTTHSTYSSL